MQKVWVLKFKWLSMANVRPNLLIASHTTPNRTIPLKGANMTNYKYRMVQENLIIVAVVLITASATISIGYCLFKGSICGGGYEYPLTDCDWTRLEQTVNGRSKKEELRSIWGCPVTTGQPVNSILERDTTWSEIVQHMQAPDPSLLWWHVLKPMRLPIICLVLKSMKSKNWTWLVS